MAALPAGDAWQQGDEENLTVIQGCYCPACGKSNAVSTMLPTKVPMFREIYIMNLDCEDCAFRNAEVNFGGEIQERGERLSLTVTSESDLNRQVIKSDSATLHIPALELEIPAMTQRGTISTLEGVLKRAADNLQELQPERLRLGDLDNFYRCQAVIAGLRRMAGEPDKEDEESEKEEGGEGTGEVKEKKPIFPFVIIMDDPAGNSFIENPYAPKPDPNLVSEKYQRTPNQDMSLGLQPSQQAQLDGQIDDANPQHKNIVNSAQPNKIDAAPKGLGVGQLNSRMDPGDERVGREEVMSFPTTCPNCYRPSETDMCVTDIPHFKEVIIMSMLCEHCGYKSNEIKGGGAIPKYGNRIRLSVRHADDLAREILKSDTAGIAIPELELEMDEGSMDGFYTTVEGMLEKLIKRLQTANPFGTGDAATKQHLTNDGTSFSKPSENHVRYMEFLKKLEEMQHGKRLPFTLEITDPLSNSFIGPVPKDAIALSFQAEKDGNNQCYEDYVDSGMTVEEYERTSEQNDILGLNDMKTENYATGEGGKPASSEYYGTDQLEELPDRMRRVDVRGPDHPHQVGKAPVDNDNTVMGAGSANFAVPGMALRGQRVSLQPVVAPSSSSAPTAVQQQPDVDLVKLVREFERKDDGFFMNDKYDGPRQGKVYKDGGQGIGYYTDVTIMALWEKYQKENR